MRVSVILLFSVNISESMSSVEPVLDSFVYFLLAFIKCESSAFRCMLIQVYWKKVTYLFYTSYVLTPKLEARAR